MLSNSFPIITSSSSFLALFGEQTANTEQPPDDASGPVSHTPVLPREVLDGLAVRPGGQYIDGTIGLGGHAEAILAASAPGGRLLGIDADPQAVALARQRLRPSGHRAVVIQGNFRMLRQLAIEHAFSVVDGIILDLGLSSAQLSAAGRGFSFMYDSPLDMRMDPSTDLTAADLVNELDEAALARLLRDFGEEPQARRVARAIVRARPLQTTKQLSEVVGSVIGRPGLRLHPATRTFQALRIAVNHELDNLGQALAASLDLLRRGARLAVISFHSLEDRIVKQFFRRESLDCVCPPSLPVCVCSHHASLRLPVRSAIIPTAEEIAANPRSRSARLRLAERL